MAVGGSYLLGVYPNGLYVHLVKLGGILNQGLIPVGPNIVNDIYNGLCQLCITFIGFFLGLLEYFHCNHSQLEFFLFVPQCLKNRFF